MTNKALSSVPPTMNAVSAVMAMTSLCNGSNAAVNISEERPGRSHLSEAKILVLAQSLGGFDMNLKGVEI